MTDDLIAFLHQQFENQRFRGESLKTLAFALPPETGEYLTETGNLLLADVDAKRRILDLRDGLKRRVRSGGYDTDQYALAALEVVISHMALPFADCPGYRDELRP